MCWLSLAGLTGEAALPTWDSVHSQCPAFWFSAGIARTQKIPLGQPCLNAHCIPSPALPLEGPLLRHFLPSDSELSILSLPSFPPTGPQVHRMAEHFPRIPQQSEDFPHLHCMSPDPSSGLFCRGKMEHGEQNILFGLLFTLLQ